MNNQNITHLSEEQIMELAMGSMQNELQKHIDECEECLREVNEFREVKKVLQSIEDDDVPSALERQIFRSVHTKNTALLTKLFETPIIITITTLVIVILLYLIVGAMLD
jgi:hypothetical protein